MKLLPKNGWIEKGSIAVNGEDIAAYPEKKMQKPVSYTHLPGDIYGFEKTNSLRLSFSYVTPEEFSLAAETLAKVVRHGV